MLHVQYNRPGLSRTCMFITSVDRHDNSSEKEMPIKGHIELSRTEIAAKPSVQGTKR